MSIRTNFDPEATFHHSKVRKNLKAALRKQVPADMDEDMGGELFHPWEDLLPNVLGQYALSANTLMVELLEAIRDGRHDEVIEKHDTGAILGFSMLAGHGLTDYGSSPFSAWPAGEVVDLWEALIDKWKEYNQNVWGVEYDTKSTRSAGPKP